MRHGNFDTEKVSVTFSCVRIFYFSRKLQSSNDLINAGFLRQVLRSCQFGLENLSSGAAGLGLGEGGDRLAVGSRAGGHLPTFVLI